MFMFYSVLALPPTLHLEQFMRIKVALLFLKAYKKRAQKTKRSHKHQISASGKIHKHVIILTYQN